MVSNLLFSYANFYIMSVRITFNIKCVLNKSMRYLNALPFSPKYSVTLSIGSGPISNGGHEYNSTYYLFVYNIII